MGQPWWIIVTCVNTLDFCNATDHYIVPRCGAGRCEVKTLNGCRDFRTYDMRKHLRRPSGMGTSIYDMSKQKCVNIYDIH